MRSIATWRCSALPPSPSSLSIGWSASRALPDNRRWSSLEAASYAIRAERSSLDHLVRAQQQRLRDREPKRLGGLEVDHELELGRLFHGKLAGLRAFEDLVDEACEPEIKVGIVHRVTYQSTRLDELAGRIGGRQPVAGHQVNDHLLMELGETVCSDEKRVDMLADCAFECAAQVALAPHVKKLSLETQGTSRRLCLVPFGRGSRIAHVVKQCNSRQIRNQLFKELNPFRCQLGAEGRHSRNIAPRPREARHHGARVAHRRHDHWNGCSRVLGGPRGRGPPAHDQIDLETHQLGRELREPLGATICRSIFDDQVSPFDVAELPQPLAQSVEIGGVLCGGYRFENTDAIDLPRLLRARSNRRGTENRRNSADDGSPVHLPYWNSAPTLSPLCIRSIAAARSGATVSWVILASR